MVTTQAISVWGIGRNIGTIFANIGKFAKSAADILPIRSIGTEDCSMYVSHEEVILPTSGSLDTDDMVRSMTSSKLLSANFFIKVIA